jgi:hypothetical protein
MLARLLRPLFTFALARTNEAQQTTTGWGADLPPHREVIQTRTYSNDRFKCS